MANDDCIGAEQRFAQEKIHNWLQTLADGTGPSRLDATGETAFNDEPGEAPVGAPLLGEWVVVMHWTDDRGDSFLTSLFSPNLPTHVREGLLHRALYSM